MSGIDTRLLVSLWRRVSTIADPCKVGLKNVRNLFEPGNASALVGGLRYIVQVRNDDVLLSTLLSPQSNLIIDPAKTLLPLLLRTVLVDDR